MSTPVDQYRDYLEQNQQAFATAVDSWTRTVEQAVTAGPTNPIQADPQQVVDQVFDFAERMLAMQRSFAHSVLANSLTLSSRVTESTRAATEPASDEA